MDETAVTNRQFAPVQVRHRLRDDGEGRRTRRIPGADPAMLVPSSITSPFRAGRPLEPDAVVGLDSWVRQWRHREVPPAIWTASEDHPVTVTWEDAEACRWAGKELPTEVQWERAGRGGIEGAELP